MAEDTPDWARDNAPDWAKEEDNQSPGWGETALDVGKQAAASVPSIAEGLVTGPINLIGLAGRGVEALGFGRPSPEEEANRAKLKELIDTQGGSKGINQYLPEAKTREGRYARSALEWAGSMAAAPGRLAVNVPAGLAGGLASEAAGEYTAKTPLEPAARAITGIAGALAPATAARSIARIGAYRGSPTLAQLEESRNGLYGEARNLGVEFNSSSLSGGIADIKKNIEVNPDSAEKVFKRLNAAEREFAAVPERSLAPEGVSAEGKAYYETMPSKEKAPVPFDKVEALRRDLGDIIAGTDRTERKAAIEAQRGLDNWLASVTGPDVIKGDAAQLAQISQLARADAAAVFRMRAMEAVRESAELKAEKGINLERAFRNELSAFIKPNRKGTSPAMKEGFNKQEIAEIRRATKLGSLPNMLRIIGVLGGPAPAAGLGVAGYAAGDPTYWGAAGLGLAGRHLGAAMQRGRMNQVVRMTGARSPLAQQMDVKIPTPDSGSMLSAMPRLLGPAGFKKGGRVLRSFRVKA